MAWSIVAAIFFGIYGSLINPVVGLFGFITPIMIYVVRKKAREEAETAHLEQQARYEVEERWRQGRELALFENRLRDRLNEKLDDVRRTFRMTAKTSPMGLRDYRRFDREIIRFLETGLSETDLEYCQESGVSVRKIYEQSISVELHENMESNQEKTTSSDSSFNGDSPIEFERYCGQLFRSFGWHVVETPASGDHGVDLIVKKMAKPLLCNANSITNRLEIAQYKRL